MKRVQLCVSSTLVLLTACDLSQNLGPGLADAATPDGSPTTQPDAGHADAVTPRTDGGPPGFDAGKDSTADGASDCSVTGCPTGSMCALANGVLQCVPTVVTTGDAGDANAPLPDATSPSNCPAAEGTQGTVLASAIGPDSWHIAIDSANVYWTSSSASQPGTGSVRAVPKAGGATVVIASAQDVPFSVVTDGSFVYWTAATATFGTYAVMKAPIGGGATTTFWSNVAYGEMMAMATDGTSLFWNLGNSVLSEPLAGGATTLYAYLPMGAQGNPAPYAIAVSGGTVYSVGEPANATSTSLPSTIVSFPDTPATPPMTPVTTVLASNQAFPQAIAADSSGVYWANSGVTGPATPPPNSGSIMAFPANASAPVALVGSTNVTAAAIAVDGVNVYWVDGDSIMKVPVGGGAATTLVTGEQGAADLKVDATDVYWVNSCFGTVKKIAK